MITELFRGMRWLADLHKLGAEYAAEANNIWMRSGGLHPLRFGAKVEGLTSDWTFVREAYTFNGRLIGTYVEAADFVEHPNNDAYDRLYFVDPGNDPNNPDQGLIKFHDGDAIPGGQMLDMTTAHRLGIPGAGYRTDGQPYQEPLLQMSLSTGIVGSNRDVFITHLIHTFVNKWGEESAPSPPSEDFTYRRTKSSLVYKIQANLTGDQNIIGVRVYMAINGSYYRVDNYYAPYTYESDGYKVENLTSPITPDPGSGRILVPIIVSEAPNEEMVSLSWDRAPEGIKHLIMLDNQVMVAARKGQILISVQGYIHAFPADTIHRRNIAGQIRGLMKVTGGFVVLTEIRAHLFLGYTAENIVEINIDFPYPIGDKRSLVSVDGSAVWITNQGIAAMGSNGGDILTRDFADRDTWGQYIDWENCQCKVHEQRVIVFCNRPSVNAPKGYIFDLKNQEVTSFDCSQDALDGLVYLDPESGEIWYSHNDYGLNRFNRGAYTTAKWRSGRIDVPQGYMPGGCLLQSDKISDSQILKFDMGLGEDVDGTRLQDVQSDVPFWSGLPHMARWFQFQVEANSPVSKSVIEQDVQDA